jgi:hypothetical protein
MITQKALFKAKVLIFWEKHGLKATLDAFPVEGLTLYLWKQKWIKGNKKPEALNDKPRTPKPKEKDFGQQRLLKE